jgi:hypothetical protein
MFHSDFDVSGGGLWPSNSAREAVNVSLPGESPSRNAPDTTTRSDSGRSFWNRKNLKKPLNIKPDTTLTRRSRFLSLQIFSSRRKYTRTMSSKSKADGTLDGNRRPTEERSLANGKQCGS